MGIILFWIALILTILFAPIGMISAFFIDRKTIVDRYFYRLAIILDIFGNAMMAPLFNKILIKKNSIYPFGKFPNTISYALGKNKELGTLTKTGSFIVKVLHWLDPNHVEEAVEKPNESLKSKKNDK